MAYIGEFLIRFLSAINGSGSPQLLSRDFAVQCQVVVRFEHDGRQRHGEHAGDGVCRVRHIFGATGELRRRLHGVFAGGNQFPLERGIWIGRHFGSFGQEEQVLRNVLTRNIAPRFGQDRLVLFPLLLVRYQGLDGHNGKRPSDGSLPKGALVTSDVQLLVNAADRLAPTCH